MGSRFYELGAAIGGGRWSCWVGARPITSGWPRGLGGERVEAWEPQTDVAGSVLSSTWHTGSAQGAGRGGGVLGGRGSRTALLYLLTVYSWPCSGHGAGLRTREEAGRDHSSFNWEGWPWV